MREARHPGLTLLLAFAGLVVFNAVFNPAFFDVRVVDGRLTGSFIDVIDRATPVILVSLGMMLVIATGGIDLSVGAVMALSGSVAALCLNGLPAPTLTAIIAGLAAGVVCGAWNGGLVVALGLPPIVATLILMVAGRGVAQLLTDGQILLIDGSHGFSALGGGWFLALPMPIWILGGGVLAVYAVSRGTALGLFIEAIGDNESASRIAGVAVRSIRFFVYILSGAFAALAGLVYASDITAADANNAGLYVELDAILTVVIGGTSLTGGRFFISGVLLGGLLIQALTTTILMTEIGGQSLPPELNLIVKALVVLLVCLLRSNRWPRRLSALAWWRQVGDVTGSRN